MARDIETFTREFFKNLKCSLIENGDVLIVENVPRSFEDLFGKRAPYKLSFKKQIDGIEYVINGSHLLSTITKYLDGASKTTLLKIDFEVDPLKEIERIISLKNCEINNISKKHRNNFFSRFTFITVLHYLNESEQVINEVYVHEGKVVEGDLSGYNVIEGDGSEASSAHLEGDYKVARELLKGLLKEKTQKVGEILGEKLEIEIDRIKAHYDSLIGELGGDLSGQVEKVRRLELELRSAEGEEANILRAKLDRLRKSLVKIGDDDSKSRILKEQEFTIKDAMHKHSLNIDNKLVNTTIIYYPVFLFNLFLKGDNSGRYVERTYNPLTREIDRFSCESCSADVSQLNLCISGHISCDNCLDKCGECGKHICEKCLKRSCSSCGKLLCKECSTVCLGCGKHSCDDHLRTDCVSGEDRCVRCLRACLRCHGLSSQRYFGEALDGSKVCQKCLGAEKRGNVMKEIFKDE